MLACRERGRCEQAHTDNPPVPDYKHAYYHIHSMTMTGTLFPGGFIGDDATSAFPSDLQAIIDLPRWRQDDWLAQKRSLRALEEASVVLAPLHYPEATVGGDPL